MKADSVFVIMGREVMNMEFLTLKDTIVDGVDKYVVSELKRVYGSVEYDGEEFVFLYAPEMEDATRAYRPESYVMAVMLDDEIFDGKVLQYFVTLTYDGHVKGVEYLGLDDAGRPDAIEVE